MMASGQPLQFGASGSNPASSISCCFSRVRSSKNTSMFTGSSYSSCRESSGWCCMTFTVHKMNSSSEHRSDFTERKTSTRLRSAVNAGCPLQSSGVDPPISSPKNAVTATAHDGKSCRRHFDFCTRQSHWRCPDVTANCLPYFIVPMFETGDCMSDLVQNCVSYFGIVIE